MRHKQPYTLYKRARSTKRWTHMGYPSYFKETAIRVFQTILINNTFNPDFEVRLRPVNKKTEGK